MELRHQGNVQIEFNFSSFNLKLKKKEKLEVNQVIISKN